MDCNPCCVWQSICTIWLEPLWLNGQKRILGVVMSEKVRPYGEFEFCKATRCNRLVRSSTHADQFRCLVDSNDRCIKKFKQFQKWLNDNNFMILKVLGEDDD